MPAVIQTPTPPVRSDGTSLLPLRHVPLPWSEGMDLIYEDLVECIFRGLQDLLALGVSGNVFALHGAREVNLRCYCFQLNHASLSVKSNTNALK
ncbi:hypothetical protein EJB05_14474 [Eragrostis curvula]|uniref:Uncharacterized protein n=1 Tax=Eragrostis curvula TaxID=38414 RepID=A0A5J9VZB9_9POAL|nr:hypothetical protein EJB05_14474 [Eragrostis curvula]